MSSERPPATADLPAVTIVIIVYNDEHRIDVAIRSALAQNLRDIEVLVVDHGSTDGTVGVVRHWATTEPRLRLLELGDNEGQPGRPLNAGINAASGRFVTLMGSDDEIDQDACRAMLAAAEVHDADVVMGRTDRIFLDEGGRVGSWFHKIYRQGRCVHESIFERPGLMWDTISAAKLYRRSFLDEHDLRLPEDLIYEDQLFTAQVYLKARRIVVLPQTVYRWTVLGQSQHHRPSLTNTRDSVRNLQDRITVNRRIDEFYENERATELVPAKQRKFFSHDLYLYLRDLGERDDAYRTAFIEIVGEYVRSIDLDVLAELEQPLRALAFSLRRGHLEAARQAFEMHRNAGRLVPLLEWREDRIYLEPAMTDTEPPETKELAETFLDVTALWEGEPTWRHLHATARVRASSSGQSFELEGELHDPLDVLRSPILRLELELRRRQRPRESLTMRCVAERDDSTVRWRAVVLASELPNTLSFHQVWDSAVLVHVGSDRPVRIRVFTDARDLQGVHLRARFPVSAFFGRRFTGYSTTKGHLSFRLEDRPLGAAIVQRVRPAAAVLRRTIVAFRQQTERVNRRLVSLAYRIAVLLPRRDDLVVFEAFEGRSYAGDPRRISEALAETCPYLRQAWLCSSKAVERTFPGHVTVAVRGSVRASMLLGRAAYWVDNFGFPARYGKPARTCYVQTWHGTPVKLMMLDALSVTSTGPEHRQRLEELTGRWDILLSSGEYFNKTFVRSCTTSARTLTIGSPRVDALVERATRPPYAIREELALPAARHAILYAPTYRPGWSLPAIDWRLLTKQLGSDVLVLVRNHYFRRPMPIPASVRDRVIDVSARGDVNELLLASEVLVTDYSSLMFDYSVLERPLVIFAPDLDRYEREVGTYLDLRQNGPGALTQDTVELAEAIREGLAAPAGYSERSAWFRKTYSDAEQGRATRSVLAEVWDVPPSTSPLDGSRERARGSRREPAWEG